nr:serine/threonine-protein kinase pim-3-like [Danio rerio]|eukprot:XP_021335661.1 serine/threonine-protein kinase pim-3-like [Danio rerio]
MLILKHPSASMHVIEMYEWFDQAGFISLVMEYPQPCVSLRDYIYMHDKLSERVARSLLHQLVQAMQHCIDHDVSHNDMHADNILVNTTKVELKLIDFGCATKIRAEDYQAVVFSSIWNVGYMLYFMVHGRQLVNRISGRKRHLLFGPSVSSDCWDLIEKCMDKKLSTLEDVLQHQWMKKQEMEEQG